MVCHVYALYQLLSSFLDTPSPSYTRMMDQVIPSPPDHLNCNWEDRDGLSCLCTILVTVFFFRYTFSFIYDEPIKSLLLSQTSSTGITEMVCYVCLSYYLLSFLLGTSPSYMIHQVTLSPPPDPLKCDFKDMK